MSNDKAIALIRGQLEHPKFKEQIASTLPPQVPPERFMRTALTAIRQSPQLVKCDRASLFGSIVTAAQLGLPLETALGIAYLVPYKNKVTLIVGYRGLVELARRSGQLLSVEADVIYDTDEVTWQLGDDSRLTIDRDWDTPPGNVVGAYAVAKLKDGGVQRVVMTKAEIEKIRKASPSGNSPAWKDSYNEMAKKCALRRLCKLLPLSVDAQNAVAVDEANEAGKVANVKDGYVEIEGDFIVDNEGAAPTEAPETDTQDDAKGKVADAAMDEIVGKKPPESELQVDPETGEVLFP